jgi:hypothetical protein
MQVLIGLSFGAIALSALKVDVVNNYEYGLSVSPELATVLIIAAVCVGALPAIAGVTGWSLLLGAMTGLSIMVTCWAAINAYTEKMGTEILAKTGQAAQYESAEKDQALARRTLERIKETADTATLERLIAAAKETAAKHEAGDSKKMGSQSCFKFCREAKAAHAALLDRLSEAKARDAAKAELAKAKTEAKAGPAEASMAATWIAARTGRNAADIARTISLVMAIGGIFLTQGFALFAHPAASLIFGGVRPVRAIREEIVAEIKPRRPVSAAAIKNATIRNEFDAFEFVLGKLRSSQNRVYRGSANMLADEAGVARSTFASWVQRWVAEGRIETLRQGRITEFRFPQQPRLRRVV